MLVPYMEPEDAVMVYACASVYEDHRLEKSTISKAAQMPSPGWLQLQMPVDALERLVSYLAE